MDVATTKRHPHSRATKRPVRNHQFANAQVGMEVNTVEEVKALSLTSILRSQYHRFFERQYFEGTGHYGVATYEKIAGAVLHLVSGHLQAGSDTAIQESRKECASRQPLKTEEATPSDYRSHRH